MIYTPPPPPAIMYQAEENYFPQCKPYYYECDGCIINLAAATKFYVDHFPFTSYYWPRAKIGSNSYQLTSSMSSHEEAMQFLKELIAKIEEANNKH